MTRNQSLFLGPDINSLSLKDQPQPITCQDRFTKTDSISDLPTHHQKYLPAGIEGEWCLLTSKDRPSAFTYLFQDYKLGKTLRKDFAICYTHCTAYSSYLRTGS